MTIRLRPHHLLCLLTYAGKGYSPAFIANFDAVAGRISQGEDILIVEGPDDICAPLLSDSDPHCRRDSVTERDRLAARDLDQMMPGPVQSGAKMKFDTNLLRRMRVAFAEGRSRQACSRCEWSDLCSLIAANSYGGALVHGAQ